MSTTQGRAQTGNRVVLDIMHFVFIVTILGDADAIAACCRMDPTQLRREDREILAQITRYQPHVKKIR